MRNFSEGFTQARMPGGVGVGERVVVDINNKHAKHAGLYAYRE